MLSGLPDAIDPASAATVVMAPVREIVTSARRCFAVFIDPFQSLHTPSRVDSRLTRYVSDRRRVVFDRVYFVPEHA